MRFPSALFERGGDGRRFPASRIAGGSAAALAVAAVVALLGPSGAVAQVAVKADTVVTMAGEPIRSGVIVCGADGRIQAVGPADQVAVPDGVRILEAAVAMPGIVDARTTVGLSGILNYDHDQEQLERSAPMQPELRAVDAYNALDPLVEWVRQLGVTTIHTGHAPGALISGQTMIIKTDRTAISDGVLRPLAAIAGSLGGDALGADGKSPGTRAKAVALLRAELLKAQDYARKHDKAAGNGQPNDDDRDDDDRDEAADTKDAEPPAAPERDLHLEVLAAVLGREIPLVITAHRHHDIDAALRLQQEFGFRLILDGASEAYLLLDRIKAAGVEVIVHPTMARPNGEQENMTFTLAAKLHEAGIPFAFQSGYEGYVPKTRVVLFEAAFACAYGLPREAALAACTIQPARILGISDRVGSIEPGKDADLALYDGDPLEYTTHCVGVVIDGKVASTERK